MMTNVNDKKIILVVLLLDEVNIQKCLELFWCATSVDSGFVFSSCTPSHFFRVSSSFSLFCGLAWRCSREKLGCCGRIMLAPCCLIPSAILIMVSFTCSGIPSSENFNSISRHCCSFSGWRLGFWSYSWCNHRILQRRGWSAVCYFRNTWAYCCKWV